MSSSGLIYAVIVGAWAAYLVPMWLRRQDELNEARPTERFSTAIRLLSGRAAMERRVSKHLADDGPGEADGERESASAPASVGAPSGRSAGSTDHQELSRGQSQGPLRAKVQLQGQGKGHGQAQMVGESSPPRPVREQSVAGPGDAPRPVAARQTPSPLAAGTSGTGAGAGRGPESQRRATLLARRRRMVILLFAAFTVGMIMAAVGGIALIWIPAVPAVLFSIYIAHMRRQERRRFEVKIDRRRAAEAAQQVRERERERRRAEVPATVAARAPRPHDFAHPARSTGTGSGPQHTRALVDADDFAAGEDVPDEAEVDVEAALEEAEAEAEAVEWHDNPRERSADPEGWAPVPVPLPTYVTAPVAQRGTGSLDLNAPDTWSSGRAAVPPPPTRRRPPATPLFDQYAAEDTAHPRAANE